MTLPTAVRERWNGIADAVGELKSDRIVAVFERQILSGTLAAGTALPAEAELCDVLGVSRTVLRDAVRTLTARGLLTVSRGRGTAVAAPTDDAFAGAMTALLARAGVSMGEVMRTRDTIETMVVGLAADAGTADDWRRLEAAYGDLADAVARRDGGRAADAHAEFHLAILEAAHQPALTVMLAPVSKIATLTGVASVRTGSIEDFEVEAHRPILDALARRDRAGAVAAMSAHFAESQRPPEYLAHYQAFLDRPFADVFFGEAAEPSA